MPTVSAAELQADREAATERGGYVDRTLAKMKSAESSFELFLISIHPIMMSIL